MDCMISMRSCWIVVRDRQRSCEAIRPGDFGLTCPQEVFQHIDYKSDVSLGDNILLDYEINVGHRLLIFVTEMNEPDLVIKTGA